MEYVQRGEATSMDKKKKLDAGRRGYLAPRRQERNKFFIETEGRKKERTGSIV